MTLGLGGGGGCLGVGVHSCPVVITTRGLMNACVVGLGGGGYLRRGVHGSMGWSALINKVDGCISVGWGVHFSNRYTFP